MSVKERGEPKRHVPSFFPFPSYSLFPFIIFSLFPLFILLVIFKNEGGLFGFALPLNFFFDFFFFLKFHLKPQLFRQIGKTGG
jgi:hypothetical protein